MMKANMFAITNLCPWSIIFFQVAGKCQTLDSWNTFTSEGDGCKPKKCRSTNIVQATKLHYAGYKADGTWMRNEGVFGVWDPCHGVCWEWKGSPWHLLPPDGQSEVATEEGMSTSPLYPNRLPVWLQQKHTCKAHKIWGKHTKHACRNDKRDHALR